MAAAAAAAAASTSAAPLGEAGEAGDCGLPASRMVGDKGGAGHARSSPEPSLGLLVYASIVVLAVKGCPLRAKPWSSRVATVAVAEFLLGSTCASARIGDVAVRTVVTVPLISLAVARGSAVDLRTAVEASMVEMFTPGASRRPKIGSGVVERLILTEDMIPMGSLPTRLSGGGGLKLARRAGFDEPPSLMAPTSKELTTGNTRALPTQGLLPSRPPVATVAELDEAVHLDGLEGLRTTARTAATAALADAMVIATLAGVALAVAAPDAEACCTMLVGAVLGAAAGAAGLAAVTAVHAADGSVPAAAAKCWTTTVGAVCNITWGLPGAAMCAVPGSGIWALPGAELVAVVGDACSIT